MAILDGQTNGTLSDKTGGRIGRMEDSLARLNRYAIGILIGVSGTLALMVLRFLGAK